MKRFFHLMAIALTCTALTSPSAEAQGRNGHGPQQTSQRRNSPASGHQTDHGNNNNSGRGNASHSERAASGNHQQSRVSSAGHQTNRPEQHSVHQAPANNLRPGHAGDLHQTSVSKAPVGGGNRPSSSGNNRPGNGGHGSDNPSATLPGGDGNHRPGNNGGRPENGTNRPGNNGNNGNNRPGNNNKPGNGNNKPGNNGQHPGGNNNFRPGDGNNKPGNNGQHPGGNNNFRPGNNGNHGQPNFGNQGSHDHGRPNHGNPATPPPPHGYGPQGNRWHGNFHDIPKHAPHRPMLPPPGQFYRPTPPPAFRPSPRAPRFSTILGVALGSAINFTLNQLFSNGYYVTGYTNNAVYLSDVLMLNQVWPNVTLQYSRGVLTGSEFVYPMPYYDTDIYYNVYNRLQASYGVPVGMEYLTGGGMRATWFGPDGRYVNLTFNSGNALDGQLRYYTTLSFGN